MTAAHKSTALASYRGRAGETLFVAVKLSLQRDRQPPPAAFQSQKCSCQDWPALREQLGLSSRGLSHNPPSFSPARQKVLAVAEGLELRSFKGSADGTKAITSRLNLQSRPENGFWQHQRPRSPISSPLSFQLGMPPFPFSAHLAQALHIDTNEAAPGGGRKDPVSPKGVAMKRLTIWFCAAMCVAAALDTRNLAHGDQRRHDPAVRLAEDLRCAAREMRQDIRDEFRRSSIFRLLARTSDDLRRRTDRVATLTRSGGCRITIGQELDAIDFLLTDLSHLLRTARERSVRGIDPPLCRCTLYLDQELLRMRGLVCSLRETLRFHGHGWSTFGHFDLPTFDGPAPGYAVPGYPVDVWGHPGVKANQRPLHGPSILVDPLRSAQSIAAPSHGILPAPAGKTIRLR